MQKPKNRYEMSEKLLNIFYNVETTHWWWVARKRIVKNLLNKYFKNKNAIILDAGCGTGAGILYLGKYGKVYGVDSSPVAVKFCKKRGIKNVIAGDVSSLPYKNSFFDLVCLMDVIEHIKDDKKTILEMHRVLKPGGILLMTLPGLPFIYSKHDKEQGHYRRYNLHDFKKLFDNMKFKEEKLSYFNILLSIPIIIVRLVSKIFPKLADFDSKINFEISKQSLINKLLCAIFSVESVILKYLDIPFGISIISIHKKIK